ncbi:hypothetical protein B296_00006617, partial [Ensete ventricosum]
GGGRETGYKGEAAMASTKVQRIMTQPIVRSPSIILVKTLVFLPSLLILLILCCVASCFNHDRASVTLLQNLIFRFLQSVSSDAQLVSLELALSHGSKCLSQSFVAGFDEYMNLVLDEAEEVNVKKKTRKPLGWSSYFLLPVIACFSFMFHFIHPLGLLFLLYREDSVERRQHNAHDEHVSVNHIFVHVSENVLSWCSIAFSGVNDILKLFGFGCIQQY